MDDYDAIAALKEKIEDFNLILSAASGAERATIRLRTAARRELNDLQAPYKEDEPKCVCGNPKCGMQITHQAEEDQKEPDVEPCDFCGDVALIEHLAKAKPEPYKRAQPFVAHFRAGCCEGCLLRALAEFLFHPEHYYAFQLDHFEDEAALIELKAFLEKKK